VTPAQLAENAALGERKRDNFVQKKFLNFPIAVSARKHFLINFFLFGCLPSYFSGVAQLIVSFNLKPVGQWS
jgi:hypothetical protein